MKLLKMRVLRKNKKNPEGRGRTRGNCSYFDNTYRKIIVSSDYSIFLRQIMNTPSELAPIKDIFLSRSMEALLKEFFMMESLEYGEDDEILEFHRKIF